MPELPEVETVRRGLESTFVGRVVEAVEVRGRRTVRRHPASQLGSLEGQRLVGTGRRGKYLLLCLEDDTTAVLHLRMSGQLVATSASFPMAPHTHLVVRFAPEAGCPRQGYDELRFVDPRTFGEIFLSAGQATSGLPIELEGIGPDALEVEGPILRTALHGRRAPLKTVLVDQRRLAGIGNIYADEILYSARLLPARPAGSLSGPDLVRLRRAIRDVLRAAIEARGSSLADKQYRDLFGKLGDYQLSHNVHARAGQPCPGCSRSIERTRIGGRSTYFCPHCQL